jgi:predicted membrane GTPase involved in stress response
MEQMGHRKGEMTNMEVDGKGRIRIEATVPSRGAQASTLNHRDQYTVLTFRNSTLFNRTIMREA